MGKLLEKGTWVFLNGGMVPRERVQCAIGHRQTDRTPRDFWAEKPALRRLLAHLGQPGEERMLEQLGIDLRHLNAGEPPEVEISPGYFRNFWGEQYVYRATHWGPLREDGKGALAGASSMADLESFPYPSPDSMDYSRIAVQASRWDRYALVYGFADVWQRPALVRGWEQWFVDLVERPEWVHFLCRKFTDFYLEDYRRAAEASNGRIDLYLLISDLGSQRGPLLSSAMFDEFVAPYLREMIDQIHQLGAQVLYHSCGMIYPFIPRLIQLGVDVLDPIQPVHPAMSPERLRDEFGGRLCFHGGIDLQGVLSRGTPEEVRREVKRYCEVFERGGYILAPSHFFLPEVPPENILAMYD